MSIRGYTKIPNEVIARQYNELSPAAMVLYQFYCSRRNNRTGGWRCPSDDVIDAIPGMTRRSYFRAKKELESKGWIDVSDIDFIRPVVGYKSDKIGTAKVLKMALDEHKPSAKNGTQSDKIGTTSAKNGTKSDKIGTAYKEYLNSYQDSLPKLNNLNSEREGDPEIFESEKTKKPPSPQADIRPKENREPKASEFGGQKIITTRHPAIEAIKNATGNLPPKNIWPWICETLGTDPDLVLLHEVMQSWTKKGFKANNYEGILEWYTKGVPDAQRQPTKANAKSPKNDEFEYPPDKPATFHERWELERDVYCSDAKEDEFPKIFKNFRKNVLANHPELAEEAEAVAAKYGF